MTSKQSIGTRLFCPGSFFCFSFFLVPNDITQTVEHNFVTIYILGFYCSANWQNMQTEPDLFGTLYIWTFLGCRFFWVTFLWVQIDLIFLSHYYLRNKTLFNLYDLLCETLEFISQKKNEPN